MLQAFRLVRLVQIALLLFALVLGNDVSQGHRPDQSSVTSGSSSSPFATDVETDEIASRPTSLHESNGAEARGSKESEIYEDSFSQTKNIDVGIVATNHRQSSDAENSIVSNSRVENNDQSLFDDFLNDVVSDAENLLSRRRDSRTALRLFRIAGALGHTGSLATAGTLLASGDTNFRRDMRNAVRLIRLAANRGQPDAQALLAFLHSTGIAERYGVERNDGKALVYWTLAAETGSVYAQMSLGYRHMAGLGVVKSCFMASEFYRTAARSTGTDPRHFPSLENFLTQKPPLPSGLTSDTRTRLDNDMLERESSSSRSDYTGDDELLEYYRLSASHGNADALTTIGGLHLFGGHGLEPNTELARAYLDQAARMGHGEAYGILGHLALASGDNKTAVTYFKRSAQSEERAGSYALGMMYLHGVEVAKDAEAAAYHFQQATEKEHGEAAYQLGMLYWHGNGVARDPDQAYRFFQQGARLGQVQCNLNLGLMLLDGTYPVTEPDCNRGVLLLKSVAESGEWNALLTLAMDQFERKDLFGSLYRNLQGAHAGIEVAQYNAALLLEKAAAIERSSNFEREGIMALRNSEELRHWDCDMILDAALDLYEMSADQGYSLSALRAGDLAYLNAADYYRAALAYRKGASLRNAEACHSLGWMYIRGLGVTANRERATQYLNMASSYASEANLPSSLTLLAATWVWRGQDFVHWLSNSSWTTTLVTRGIVGVFKSTSEGSTGTAVSSSHRRRWVEAAFSLNSKRNSHQSRESRQPWLVAIVIKSDGVVLSGLIGLLTLTLLARRMRMRRMDVRRE